MPEQQLQEALPEKAAIALLTTYLRTCPDGNVRDLIAKRLATGVFHGNSAEVVYWAAVHHAYIGETLDAGLQAEVLLTLSKP